MNADLISELTRTMDDHGFHRVTDTSSIPDATLLLKRQTWNTNRAVVVVAPAQPPTDMCDYLRRLQRQVAFRCGFFPLFWGIGIQVVLVTPGVLQSDIDPLQYVARVDNQWAIIQSVFLADPASQTSRSGRTWGQFVTGKFQDAIFATLAHHFEPITQ
jgi:hypothetical protein